MFLKKITRNFPKKTGFAEKWQKRMNYAKGDLTVTPCPRRSVNCKNDVPNNVYYDDKSRCHDNIKIA